MCSFYTLLPILNKLLSNVIGPRPVITCLMVIYTGELGYDRLNGTRKIGQSYAKSVIYIWNILDMHGTGTKHIVRHRQKTGAQWSVISKFTCTSNCSCWPRTMSLCDILFQLETWRYIHLFTWQGRHHN